MKDDRLRNLKWLERELLAEEEVFRDFSGMTEAEYDGDDDLLDLADMLLDEDSSPAEGETPPAARRSARRRTKADRTVQARMPEFDEDAAVPVKTRRQLRRDEKHRRKEEALQKKEEKKANINRNIKGLAFLALLECIGILAIIGWWLQWLI